MTVICPIAEESVGIGLYFQTTNLLILTNLERQNDVTTDTHRFCGPSKEQHTHAFAAETCKAKRRL